MPAAIATATPFSHLVRRDHWRTLLFVTASVVAMAAAPRAMAANECGPTAGDPLAVTCPVDAGNYADGITYSEAADFTLNLDDAVIVDRALLSPGAGVTAQSTGAATLNAPNASISTLAPSSDGILLSTSSGAATATVGGTINTAGAGSNGIHAITDTGAISITSASTINTLGEGAHGILAVSGISIEGGSAGGPVSVTSTGPIVATGANSHGIVAISPAGVTVDAGDTTAPGVGVVAASSDGAVDVTVSGAVTGGAIPTVQPLAAPEDPAGPSAFSTGVLMIGNTAHLTVAGSVGSMSDNAVVSFSPATTVDNNGTITGYVNLIGEAVTFNNNAGQSFDLRNFSDTDADGVRDTEGVAISTFGGAGVFNNTATGAVVLLNVAGATAWDATGGFVPANVDPSFHDITQEGVEQGVLAGLAEFHNAGAIIMQDALAGGTGPVAGDILVITGGEAGPATFFSEGGTLALDTVLNEGGAASQSDILMVDATALGSGATALSIANAGGAGAQTSGNGILVVDVADPAASATGAFVMNDIVIAGPWQYQLFQGGDAASGGDAADGDWYLRSNLAPTVDLYRSYPSTLTRFSRETVGTLQQRVGNRWWRVPETQVERTETVPAPPPPPPQTREFVVYFDWDKSDIRPDAQATINEAAEYAKTGNAARIVVIGHTDTSGPEDYNMALSERRAQAVSNALQAQGVAAQVIGMEWLGETQPAVDTGDGVREQRNRRAHIQVSVPGAPTGPTGPTTRTVMETVPASTEIQGAGAWARIVGSDGEYRGHDDSRRVDEDVWMFQGGVDFVVNEDENSRLVAGVFVHYGQTDTDVNTPTFGDVGSIDTEGYGIGGSLTWYTMDGLYVDGVLTATWFDSDLSSGALGGDLASGNSGFAWSISGEAGKRIPFSEGSNYYWTPQAQLMYTNSDIDSFTDPFGANVEDDNADSLIGRVGVAIEYLNRTTADDGSVRRMQGYGIFNLLWDFLDSPGVDVSGISASDEGDDFWGELGGGFTYSINEAWSFYGEASYRTTFENFGDSHVLRGDIGVRYNW